MKDNVTTTPVSEGSAQKVDTPPKARAQQRSLNQHSTTQRKSPRPSPDAEGGQPVNELDLDGDGARRG